MTWLQRYRIWYYFANSIWIYPVLGMLASLVLVRLLLALDQRLGWTTDINPAAVETLLATMAASMFTFIVFISTALMVTIQLASSQFTPRIIAFAFRDPVTKGALTCFVFTFTLALAALIRIEASLPVLTARTAVYSCLASLGIFLYLMNHVGSFLRPSGMLRMVASQGARVIEITYPRLVADGPDTEACRVLEAVPVRLVTSSRAGVIHTMDIQRLVTLARQSDSVIEMVPRVGDFVAAGSPLFRVAGRNARPSDHELRQLVALGLERTLEHDPSYVFRIVVDIAVKALSPAINDPTTAVLAIDQLHFLLHSVGIRRLDAGLVRDAQGTIRFVYPTPDWEDFVQMAVTEIRHWGAGSVQILQRLRVMLVSLIPLLPEERARLLRQELKLLQKTAQRSFPDPEDCELADGRDLRQTIDEY